MPGRYTITAKAEEVKKRFNVEVPEGYQSRYNAAPTQILPVITNENPKGISMFYWGLIPSWSKNKTISTKLINADAETVHEKAAFKSALKNRRCLVLADGFYEWKAIGKKTKIPYRIKLKNDGLFAFAGLWDEFDTNNGDIMHTFTIITTTANSILSDFHDRMPVILDPAKEKNWLSEELAVEDLLALLQPFDAGKMTCYTVSPRVNNIKQDVPELIQFSTPADQLGNYTLFN